MILGQARKAQEGRVGGGARKWAPVTCRGAALILVLWALFVLTAAIVTWAKWIQQDIQLSGEANRNAESRAMAHSGMVMALHPGITQQSPQLAKEFGSELGFNVRMVSEGGKLNLNELLRDGGDPRKIEIFKRWLDQMGLNFQQRDEFVDCLLDYVDADNVKRLNGCEDEGEYHPANRPLLDLDELTHVRNSALLTSKPGWKENLTLYSTEGRIDLLAAPAEILRLLPGLGDARIDRFVTFRSGKDTVLGTMDDPVFQSINDVQRFLGMNELQFKELRGLVGIKDAVMHITSRGHSGKVIRQLEVVARKGGGNPAIFYWNE